MKARLLIKNTKTLNEKAPSSDQTINLIKIVV